MHAMMLSTRGLVGLRMRMLPQWGQCTGLGMGKAAGGVVLLPGGRSDPRSRLMSSLPFIRVCGATAIFSHEPLTKWVPRAHCVTAALQNRNILFSWQAFRNRNHEGGTPNA